MGIGIAVVMVSGRWSRGKALVSCAQELLEVLSGQKHSWLSWLGRYHQDFLLTTRKWEPSDCGSEAATWLEWAKPWVSIPSLQSTEDGKSPNPHAVLETLTLGFNAAFL